MPPVWKTDKSLRNALIAGFFARTIPGLVWATDTCLRDECTYLKLAERFADGQGMTSSAGWIWAPGYPFLMGIVEFLSGGYGGLIKIPQVPVSLGCIVLVYLLAREAFPEDKRVPRIAAWLYALSPHMSFFAIRLWSEVIYSALLMGGLLLLIRSWKAIDSGDDTRRGWRHTLVASVIGGSCVLFRGVATYMLPIWLFTTLWGRWKKPKAWAQAALITVAAAATVAPYSIYATQKFDGVIVSDRTMGQMMWLGNNDFDPITFDYGNGQLSRSAFRRTKLKGRDPKECGSRKNAYTRDKCQTEEGIAWIKANPQEFVSRMPMRVAQLLNPHSLLTRHLRWGRFPGMPQWMDELVVLGGALMSMLAMLGGAIGLTTRGRDSQALLFAGIVTYHCAAIAVLAGLTRYRVPLEPLLMVYAAALLANPRAAWQALGEGPLRWRLWLTLTTVAVVTPLMLWYLPAGWPWWRTW